jgi:antitoxin VapB
LETTALSAKAKIFMHGRSQAVRLPKEFRLPGTECRVRREGNAVILEPIGFDLESWWAEMDRLRALHGDFLPEGEPPEPSIPADNIDLDGAFDEPSTARKS